MEDLEHFCNNLRTHGLLLIRPVFSMTGYVIPGMRKPPDLLPAQVLLLVRHAVERGGSGRWENKWETLPTPFPSTRTISQNLFKHANLPGRQLHLLNSFGIPFILPTKPMKRKRTALHTQICPWKDLGWQLILPERRPFCNLGLGLYAAGALFTTLLLDMLPQASSNFAWHIFRTLPAPERKSSGPFLFL